jgi:hypothetical protein
MEKYSKLLPKTEDKFIELLLLVGAILAPVFVLFLDLFIHGKPLFLQWASWIIALLFAFIHFKRAL